jgi:hypothetical protein
MPTHACGFLHLSSILLVVTVVLTLRYHCYLAQWPSRGLSNSELRGVPNMLPWPSAQLAAFLACACWWHGVAVSLGGRLEGH